MIKVDELKALCDHDEAMVEMLLTIYMDEYGQSDSVIQQKYATDDLDGLFQISHELKGMFSNLCAKNAMSLAQVVESSSQAGTIPDESAISNLCGEIQVINEQIKAILQ